MKVQINDHIFDNPVEYHIRPNGEAALILAFNSYVAVPYLWQINLLFRQHSIIIDAVIEEDFLAWLDQLEIKRHFAKDKKG